MSKFYYLQRPRSKSDDRWREASILHLIDEDGQTSVCGAVRSGLHGFTIIERKRKALRSMTCINCRQGRVVSQ